MRFLKTVWIVLAGIRRRVSGCPNRIRQRWEKLALELRALAASQLSVILCSAIAAK